MPALEIVRGLRVVARGDALDRARFTRLGDDLVVTLRVAHDEVFAIGAASASVDDEDAIVEVERGYVGAWLTWFDFVPMRDHIEWAIPEDRPSVSQGAIAGVPALYYQPPFPDEIVLDGETGLLVVRAAFAAELAQRLGWDR